MYRTFVKRFVDVSMSLVLLIIMSPVFLIIGLIVYLQDRGPVLFIQKRVGKNGRSFAFYKFRSMPVNTPNVESRETGMLRVTRFGKFIRRTNMDELPQLLNIFLGDMSLIGPRPPIPSQKNLVELRRINGSLNLRPGLTGWAQVNSYDFMPETEKAKLDGIYFSDLSFIMDLKIFFKTIIYLSKKPPIY